MSRIISDIYAKKDKHIWGDDPSTEFNQKILAVNNMYGWLYEQGILQKAAFEFKDYDDAAYFALNAKDLEPYRKEMEASAVEGASLAVRHIFDEPYSPCVYSGAIELSWTMSSYRDVDGCVGRSWECSLVRNLDTEGIYEVARVRDEEGTKAAVKALFSKFDWKPTLQEQKRYQDAVEHFSKEAEADIENDFVKGHAAELVFCYEYGKTLIDFDFWTRYESLLGETISYDEYICLDSAFDGDPHDVSDRDSKTISELNKSLKMYRSNGAGSLDEKINSAASRTSSASTEPKSKTEQREQEGR